MSLENHEGRGSDGNESSEMLECVHQLRNSMTVVQTSGDLLEIRLSNQDQRTTELLSEMLMAIGKMTVLSKRISELARKRH